MWGKATYAFDHVEFGHDGGDGAAGVPAETFSCVGEEGNGEGEGLGGDGEMFGGDVF